MKRIFRLAIITLFLTACSADNQDTNPHGMEAHTVIEHNPYDSSMGMDHMVHELSGLSGEQLDKKFLELMIKHHQSAIDMAVIVREKGRREDVKVLAQKIIESQQNEIGQMRTWLQNWNQ